MKGADDRTSDGASDGAADETTGDEPVVPVAAAVAAGYDAALENLGRVMDTETPPPPPDGDQVTVLSHQIAQGTSLAAHKRDEFAHLQAQIADAIGEDEDSATSAPVFGAKLCDVLHQLATFFVLGAHVYRLLHDRHVNVDVVVVFWHCRLL